MADLRNFINPALRPGSDMDFYLSGIRIGEGKAHDIQALYVKVDGEIFGNKPYIEIFMPDTSPSGTCKIKLNPKDDPVEATYKTVDRTLEITLPDKTEVKMRIGDRYYTFVKVSGRPEVGIWPRGLAGAEEGFETEGAETEATD